ncbi:MAG: sulfatase [Verrucomicrobiota bacterium]
MRPLLAFLPRFILTVIATMPVLNGANANELPSAPPFPISTQEMNILLINVEDLNCTAVHSYGNPMAKTPHLDAFAKTAIQFNNAFVQSPVCNASRSSFITGLRTSTNNVWGNSDRFEKLAPDWATTIPEHLTTHPIETICVGKFFHHNYHANKQSSAFDRMARTTPPNDYPGEDISYSVPANTPPNPERNYQWHPNPEVETAIAAAWRKSKEIMAANPEGSDEWLRGKKIFQVSQQDRTGDSGEIDERSADGIKARIAEVLFKEYASSGKQFFLSLGFGKPHTPMLCPQKYIDLYDRGAIELSPATVDADINVPALARRKDQDHVTFRFLESEKMTYIAYLACTSFMDAQLGYVLDALEESGLANNTVVIFVSDHGFQLGEHGLWCKNVLFDQTVRVPFLIRIPGLETNGTQTDALVELVDLYPTICDLLDIPPPHNKLEGTSLLPLLADPKRKWKKAAFTELRLGQNTARTARTATHRYSTWHNPEGKLLATELYDLRTDPLEQHNLAGDPDHRKSENKMAAILKNNWKAATPRIQ